MAGLRFGAERQFGKDRAVPRERLVQPAILLGIDDVDAAGDDRDRAGLEGSEMRGCVDAAGKPGDNDDPGLAQPGGKIAGEAAAIGRGVARADHRNHRGDYRGSVSSRPSTVSTGGASSTAASALG